MTPLLQELERQLAALPPAQQEQWVTHFLEELADGAPAANGTSENTYEWVGGQRPTPEQVSEAVEKIRQLREGNVLGPDITIKELINEGRRY